MTNTRLDYFLLLLICLFFSGCKNVTKKGVSKKALQDSMKIYNSGRFILAPTEHDNINKTGRQHDTIVSKVEIDYYPSGKIHKWKEYFGDKFPKCIVYYDTNGVFDTFVGNPFLKYGERYKTNSEKWIGAATVNPPNVDYFIILGDSDITNPNAKPVYSYYEPTIKDTCAWFLFEGKLDTIHGHYFNAYFYFVDEHRNIFRRAEMEVEINDETYSFQQIPYSAHSLDELKGIRK